MNPEAKAKIQAALDRLPYEKAVRVVNQVKLLQSQVAAKKQLSLRIGTCHGCR